MKRISYAVSAAVALVALAAPFASAQQDAKGSKDHPLISRMPDYYISDYKAEEFAAFDPTVIGSSDVHWEGRHESTTRGKRAAEQSACSRSCATTRPRSRSCPEESGSAATAAG